MQNVYHFWVIAVFGAHMLCTVLLLRFLPVKASRRAWVKLKATCTIKLCRCLSLQIPNFADTKLLAACLLWPPVCFVSDATDAQGALAPPAMLIQDHHNQGNPFKEGTVTAGLTYGSRAPKCAMALHQNQHLRAD